MINYFGESWPPVSTVQVNLGDDTFEERNVFLLDDSGWLMYENKGVKLAEELNKTYIHYGRMFLNNSDTGWVGMNAVYVQEPTFSLIKAYMQNAGFADLELHEFLNQAVTHHD